MTAVEFRTPDLEDDSDSDKGLMFSSIYCNAENCDRPIDGNKGGRFCWMHRRGFTLTIAVTDALKEFLGQTGKAKIPYDKRIEEAGEHLSAGIGLLLEGIFQTEITVNPDPIHLGYSDEPGENRHSWRICFWWELTEKLKAMVWDDDDEPI